jgi:DNA phosphorothioation-associated putative methyltransferase
MALPNTHRSPKTCYINAVELMDTEKTPAILRHKTAIRRFQPSRPIAIAFEHGVIHPGLTVLDYGCGRGDDIQYLTEQGISAFGWDPHYCPHNPIREADVVNLGYVLNVIEDANERAEVLLRAFALARRALIVAVRVDRGPNAGEAFADGLITSWNGFQKLYTQAEFKAYLEQISGVAPTMASLGIAYLLKDATLQSQLLARNSVSRPMIGRQHAIEEFRTSDIGAAYLTLARSLARLPRPREFSDFEALRTRFGSPQRIARLANALLDPMQLEGLKTQRRQNFLVYYAASRLDGLKVPRLNMLSPELQGEILSIWPTYKQARDEGEAFLFSLGDREKVRVALTSSSVGKFVGDSLYAHRSAEEQLPPLARLQIFAARQIVGEVGFDLLKLSADGRKVSFLSYPKFDSEAHPSLHSATSIYLPKTDYSYRDYAGSENPPILHRKDTLVDNTYPLYEKFASLTAQEDKHGLLSRSDIGLKQTWERILLEAGLHIKGHRLLRLRTHS